MATRVLPFVTTIPAGTTSSSPSVQSINLDGWLVERLDLEVPPGPSGLMGFQIWNNSVPFIPYGTGQWFIWDDVKESFNLTELPNAGGWAVAGYNTGAYAHAVTTRWHVSPAAGAAGALVVPQVTIVTSSIPVPDPVTL